MQLTQSTSMRQEMRQLLTPRMIQSMEILQLPLMALEERIEQELQNNPVLEQKEADGEEPAAVAEAPEGKEEYSEDERSLVVKEDGDQAADFERLAKISEYLESDEYQANQAMGQLRVSGSSYDGERDKKLDAMNNTASRGISLLDHLMGQWAFVECTPGVRAAGEAIINYIDGEGYLRTELEQIQKDSKTPLMTEDLQKALALVQTLEPSGVGARNLRESLLIQLDA